MQQTDERRTILAEFSDQELRAELSRRAWAARDTGPGLPKDKRSCPACGAAKERGDDQ